MSQHFLCQHTIAREVQCEGVGLHSGAKIHLRLKPAPCDFGVRFRRSDVFGQPTISARHDSVVDTFQATSIGTEKAAISTIEHLMAALWGSSVDNVLVEVNGPEVPIFDGSAAPYVSILEDAGLREQNALRQCLHVREPFVVEDGDAFIRVKPSDFFRIRYTIDFPHPLVGRQDFSWTFSNSGFGRDIAHARTFGFLRDVEKVQTLGLARGGSLANTIVFDDSSVLNSEGFRYNDECVRHKVLDFIGDLALAGLPVFGHFEAHKAGHALHNRLVKKLMRNVSAYAVKAPICAGTTFFPSVVLPDFGSAFQYAFLKPV